MTALLLHLLAACGPSTAVDGDLVPEIEHPTASAPTGSTATTADTSTLEPECPEYYPEGIRIPDDDGWFIADGSCRVTAPPPVCEERHLGVLQPPPEGAATCDCDLDCDDGDFCGAGHCRPREGALITLCVEEVWYEGPAVKPPRGQVVISEPSAGPGSYKSIWDRALISPSGNSCRHVVRRCEQFTPITLDVDPSYYVRSEPAEACDLNLQSRALRSVEDPYQLPFSAHANKGCVPYPIDGGEGTLWVSVWYP